METLPVTLIVKAPNQQIEDQTIKCELTWTINKLKQHLSEVYPSKPPKNEQKLIYSGQLLCDSVVLKDVLRQYEGQETHTVHLVCTPRHLKSYRAESKSTQPSISASSGSATTVTQEATNNSATDQPNVPLINGVGFDPVQYTTQVAMMQQAYIQYMSQYMQLAAHSYAANGFQMPNVAAANASAAAPVQAQQQPPQAQAPPPQPPVAAQQQRDAADHPERDWLDVFYMLIRALVLFSFVYFYSSPVRFVFVLLLGIGIYLYQIGFFRNMHIINNNNNNNNVGNAPDVRQQQQEDEAPSRLMVVWTFFATFFASLIPEIPNAV